MGGMVYDINKLSSIKETNAAKAVKKFTNRKAYFDKLDEFLTESKKFLLSYNPMVVVYSPDELADFEINLGKIREMSKLLEINFLDADLASLDVAAHGGSPKSMQDELRKLTAKHKMFAERIAETRTAQDTVEDDIPEKDGIKYNMAKLAKTDDFNASEAVSAFQSQQDYFDKLTIFSKSAYKHLKAYNPTVVIFADEMNKEFMSRFNELKKLIEVLKISSADYEAKSIENAIKTQDVKLLSDELLKFNAKMEIAAKHISAAVLSADSDDTDLTGVRVVYDMQMLSNFDEFDASKAIKNFGSKKEFFNKLTELIDSINKILHFSNPTVVIYGDDTREYFIESLQKIKVTLSLFYMSFVDSEIANIEYAIQTKNSKLLIDEMSKFNSKMRILAIKISSADKNAASASSTPKINSVYTQKTIKGRKDYLNEMSKFVERSHKFLVSYVPSRAECDEEYRTAFLKKTKEVKRMITELERAFKFD